MQNNLSIIVISLIGSARRDSASLNLNSVGIPWTFFDALREPSEGRPHYDEARAIRYWGRGLSKAEIGCAASHMDVLAKLATSQTNLWAIVVEDDVILDPGFNYRSLVCDCETAGISYLRLYARHVAQSRHIVWMGQRELIRFKRAPMGTQAYLISSRAARAFIESVQTIDRPIDWEMDRFWANDLYNYALFPFPCIELTFQSSITKAPELAVEPNSIDKTARLIWKSREYFRRWLKNIHLRRRDRHIKNKLAGHSSKTSV